METKKALKDIDLNKVDVSKYSEVLPAGTQLYRVIDGPHDPTVPTGQKHRFAKNPFNVKPPQFQEAFKQGNAFLIGTGALGTSFQVDTAYREALKGKDSQEAVGYTIVFLKDITVINTIAICFDEKVDPVPKEQAEFWHSFYGPPIKAQAIRCKSAQDPNGENIIIFPDNIPDYLNIVTSKKI